MLAILIAILIFATGVSVAGSDVKLDNFSHYSSNDDRSVNKSFPKNDQGKTLNLNTGQSENSSNYQTNNNQNGSNKDHGSNNTNNQSVTNIPAPSSPSVSSQNNIGGNYSSNNPPTETQTEVNEAFVDAPTIISCETDPSLCQPPDPEEIQPVISDNGSPPLLQDGGNQPPSDPPDGTESQIGDALVSWE